MNPDLSLVETLEKFGLALGLGLLIGMQRERTDPQLAGFRTFPLATMLGTISALLALRFEGWILAAALVCLTALLIGDNLVKPKSRADTGITTEVAVFLMFGVGAYLVVGYTSVAVVLTGTIALLLHLKPEMHAFAHRIDPKEFKAIMEVVLVSLVIFPVLPNKDYGPYHALNPHKIWLAVVFIVALGLAGYVAFKLLGARGGSIVAGILGGFISSTALTVAFARRAREAPESQRMVAMVILLASTTLYVRLLIIIGVLAPRMFLGMVWPIATMLGFMVLLSIAAWFVARKESTKVPPPRNPTELKTALIFGAIFVVVLLAVPFAKQYFGAKGLYGLAAVAGLTDLDAITISTLQTGGQSAEMAWRMILLASMSNLLFKSGVTAVLGTKKLFGWTATLFGTGLVAGALLLLFWPKSEG